MRVGCRNSVGTSEAESRKVRNYVQVEKYSEQIWVSVLRGRGRGGLSETWD